MPVHATYTRTRYQVRQQRSPLLIVSVDPAIARAREDIGAFGEYVCGKVPAEIHQSWFPIIVTGESNEHLNKIAGDDTSLLSFRGSAKTTWLRIITAWAIGHNPHMQVGWVSYSEAIALKSSRVIKRILSSSLYREVFPHIRPGTRWGDTDWEVDKAFAGVSTLDSDITFQALGTTGSVTSNRFHLICFDDLIKSKKHIANEDVRAAMMETIQDAIEPCLIPGGRQIDLGTRWRNDDIHATYFTEENGWNVIEQGAIALNDDGTERSTWAERFSLPFLQEIRRKKPLTWLYQYMNQMPDLNEEMPIKPEYIKYDQMPAVLQQLTLGVDLAAGEEEKDDFTAFVLAGKADGNYYIPYCEEIRESGNLGKIKRIIELRKKWKFGRIIVEKNAYQKSFEGDWKDYCKRYGVKNLVCEMVASVDDKIMRLEAISGIFENGFVILNKHEKMGRLTAQLLGVDKDHDDLADACEKVLNRLQRRDRRPLKASD